MEFLPYIFMGLAVVFLISRMKPTSGVRQISTAELKLELNNKNKQFIDVRTPMEFKGKHIQQFQNIPLNTIGNSTNMLSKDKEIIVICQSGMRSNAAVKQLKKAGFTKLANVKGGLNAW
ncbi:putative adenylyltransferase/sulfurtransferase MoeZ [Bacillus sp. THAF10]|uniref:rhodanese-like domain-containing protein n=1 Tax=Bacillus sp. THAF10 TaxID=2587848 RepID=UPI00126790E3|nr:rhodanese-like domain-containing protein [Bacillus sp. THAF10]QFT90513.1 putative adenylyltransferase/sulfurtransferase MoeZ [Bacillus sp. THAF10]